MPFNFRSICLKWQSLNPHTRNVLQLGIGFFFIFLAFNSQGFIEESVLDGFTQTGQVDKHSGYTSLSIIYASFTICNFVAPPIIRFLGTRTSLAVSGCAYVLFLAGFLTVHQWFLYGTSALLGLAAAVLWTAQGKYLTLNSNAQNAGRNSSLFLCCAQACLSCGGLFLLVVFLLTPDVTNQIQSSSSNSSIVTNAFTPETVRLLYSFFTGIALIGVIVLSLLPPAQRVSANDNTENVKKEENEDKFFFLVEMQSIFKIAVTPKMIALAVVFANTGILLSFWSSIFPTSIINTLVFQSQFSPKVLIALNGIVKGAGQPFLSLMFERLQLDRVRKSRIIFVGALIQFLAVALCFVNLPNVSPLGRTAEDAIIRPRVWIALLCGFLLSFGDACWSTQIFAFLITNYPTQSTQAFALLKFYQSLLTALLFFFSGYMSLYWHLLILLISGALGYWAFAAAERMEIISEKRHRVGDKIESIVYD